MRIIQIIAGPSGNIIALTDQGDLFNGFFIDNGPFAKPDWGWRKMPSLDEKCFEMKRMREPTLKELERVKNQAESDAKFAMAQAEERARVTRIPGVLTNK